MVLVLAGSPVAEGSRGRRGSGELQRDSPYVLRRDAAVSLSLLRRVPAEVFCQLVPGDVGVLLDEAGVVEALLQDDVAHGEGHNSIGSRLRVERLVCEALRVGVPHVEAHDFRPVGVGVGHALVVGVHEVAGLQNVAPEDYDVVAAREVRHLYVGSPPRLKTHLLGGLTD